MSAALIRSSLRGLASPERERMSASFFKTSPGQYGHGDIFIGVRVPDIRQAIKPHAHLPLAEVESLLHSGIHEERLAALLVLVARFGRLVKAKDAKARQETVDFYLRNTASVNNWDLVDASAWQILGVHLIDKDRRLLRKLAESPSLWERRIAIVATFAFIREGESADACAIARLLLGDKHDLIHKAVGWMLREVGKRAGEEPLRAFLRRHAPAMPRTALRYAIERMDADERRAWLAA